MGHATPDQTPPQGNGSPSVTVVVADDHPLVREALRHALQRALPGVVVLEAASLPEATALVRESGPVDLVLLDLNMPGMDGFTGLAALRSAEPALPVAIVSATADAQIVRRALEIGAAGFLPKSAPMETIAQAIQAILEGEIWVPADPEAGNPSEMAARARELTPQQLKVLSMISQGLPNKQIAYVLQVSEPTVKAHVTAILRKLGVNSRTQAVIAARLIDLRQDP
jgi:DNA-binding NarL/FixJ family response regulator